MKVLSLFDGISCGMVALERAGILVEEYHAFEIDQYAVEVSSKNYPSIVHHGDVFNGDFTQFRGFDLLLGGSPCTYWSIAKKDREITPDGVGGQLFMQYVRALKESGCKWFLYENNYSIHNDIKAFISEQLGVEPIVINSALVSGQSRKRCDWTNIPNVTQPQDKEILLKDVLESGIGWQDKSYCVTATYDRAIFYNTLEKNQRTMIAEQQTDRQTDRQTVYSIKDKSVRLQSNPDGSGAKTGLYKIDLPDGDYTIRKLTPVECERLQTLPDNYTEGISNTQRYKCIGNGWTVNVIAHILFNLQKEGWQNDYIQFDRMGKRQEEE